MVGNVKEEEDEDEQLLSSPGVGFIDHPLRIGILQEMSKFRKNLGMNLGSVYEKETAWREVHDKVVTGLGLKNLSMKRLKELIKFWQAKAFHASIKLGKCANMNIKN